MSAPILAQLSPQNISIPMRDGKSLSAHLYLPNAADTFPVILIQTPYNKNLYPTVLGLPLGMGFNLASSNYAFVIVDWRCFFGSFAACVASPNRGEDGYDAVEWIAAQPWCNGKVGTLGASALGNVQFQTAYEQPPHLVCAVPEVAAPWENYHKYYPGGSLRVEYLETLSLLFGGFGLVIDNPYYNLLWQIAENTTMKPQQVEIPMLLVGGWFDHNIDQDMLLIDTLAKASAPAVRDKHKILIGPWTHYNTGAQQGELSFPEAAQENASTALQFFDYYIRGVENGWESNSRYIYFQMGDNTWDQSDSWPPAAETQTLYLQPNGDLLPAAPSGNTGFLEFVYDPEDPSPTVGGKTLKPSLAQGPLDQAPEVESRDDVLIFTTPPLSEDLPVQGKIRVDLFVASDRIDTDFALRLTEVYPDGRSMLLDESVQRMRFRNGYTQGAEAFMTPGEVYPVSLYFEDLANTFRAGNRLRLVVSSSNYPRYNRNMNTGGAMLPDGNIDTLVNPLLASNRVSANAQHPSRIELPLGQAPSGAGEPIAPAGALKLFPNPFSSELSIQTESPGEVAVFDLQGRLLGRWQKGPGIFSLPLERLPDGVYLVRVNTTEGVISGSAVKKKE
jgi:uncharacterized protein